MRESISSWKISRCSITRTSACCGVMSPPCAPIDSVNRQEIAQQLVTALTQNRLRVKLHAVPGKALVPHAHDLAVVGPGGDRQRLGQRLTLDDEGMVACGFERFAQALEHAF